MVGVTDVLSLAVIHLDLCLPRYIVRRSMLIASNYHKGFFLLCPQEKS